MDIQSINRSIETQKNALLQHSLYEKVETVEDLRCFLESHVYAVWDFMSLLKALQSKLTCTTTPWIASKNPETRYLINEIVLAEESDLTLDGKRQSHFEMYLDAMTSCGANTEEINTFIENVVATQNIFVSIKQSDLHPNIKAFLDFTFRVIEQGKPHEIAAAFTFGREDLIPGMFISMVKEFNQQFQGKFDQFIYYLERHIEVDGSHHSNLAIEMTASLCGEDQTKWNEVKIAAEQALLQRIQLWDHIQLSIQ
jgi:hypothetical protein